MLTLWHRFYDWLTNGPEIRRRALVRERIEYVIHCEQLRRIGYLFQ